MGGLVLYEEAKTFSSLHQNSKLLETMNSKQKSRLNLVKIQRVCPRGVRADPGIHRLRARDFPTERVLSRTPLIVRTVDKIFSVSTHASKRRLWPRYTRANKNRKKMHFVVARRGGRLFGSLDALALSSFFLGSLACRDVTRPRSAAELEE